MIYLIDYFGNRIDVYPWAVWLIVGLITAIVIAFYVLRSIGVYKLADKAGVDKKYLAFIPIAWVYPLSKIAGDVYFFGTKIKKFALCMLIIFLTAEILEIAYYLVTYIPLIGYYLQGGDVMLTSGNVTIVGARVYPFDGYIFVGDDFVFGYTQAYVNLVRVLYYVSSGFSLVSLVFLICLYSSFFRKYWPSHVFLGIILSIFGFFPIVVFVLRNKAPFDYQAYIRNMMQNMGYPNPNANPNNSNGSAGSTNANPFSEFDDNKGASDNGSSSNGSSSSGSEEPFDEFSDKDGK